MSMEMYKPDFPSNFPRSGVWEITYFDEYEEGYPLHTCRMFVSEHMGKYKLLRDKSRYGWSYRTGEMNKWLLFSEWEKADSPFFFGSVEILHMDVDHSLSKSTVYKRGSRLLKHARIS